jgi:hypothetical protein
MKILFSGDRIGGFGVRSASRSTMILGFDPSTKQTKSNEKNVLFSFFWLDLEAILFLVRLISQRNEEKNGRS